MQNCWVLMLLVVAGVTAAPTKTPLLSYEQVLAAAIVSYNRDLGSGNAFRLLEAEPQENWDPSAQTIQTLKFSITETNCPADKTPDAAQCEEKKDGVDQDCSGFYSAEQNPPVTIIQCEDVDQEMSRITRGRWRRFWGKAKRFVRKNGVRIALAAVPFVG